MSGQENWEKGLLYVSSTTFHSPLVSASHLYTFGSTLEVTHDFMYNLQPKDDEKYDTRNVEATGPMRQGRLHPLQNSL